ncbi:hypothetical protein PM082_015011 [Marasmius tenuissimus]|nr:hypothetical protein PM082_015011 [Marasmius tenuissimus]
MKGTQCFSIQGIPNEVTERQQVTFTWFRDMNDPTSFGVAKTKTRAEASLVTDVGVTRDQTEGTMIATFMNAGQTLSIVGYDLLRVDKFALLDSSQPRPSPFFIDNGPITIVTKGPHSTTSPSSPGASSSEAASETGTQSATISSDNAVGASITTSSEKVTDSGSQPTFSSTAPQTQKGAMNPGAIAGVALGIITLLSFIITIGWIFMKRGKREQVISRTESSDNVYPTPLNLSSTIEVTRRHHEDTDKANDILPIHHRTECREYREYGSIIVSQNLGTLRPPDNLIVEAHQMSESRGILSYAGTDQGSSQQLDTGNRSAFEILPSYSEAVRD